MRRAGFRRLPADEGIETVEDNNSKAMHTEDIAKALTAFMGCDGEVWAQTLQQEVGL